MELCRPRAALMLSALKRKVVNSMVSTCRRTADWHQHSGRGGSSEEAQVEAAKGWHCPGQVQAKSIQRSTADAQPCTQELRRHEL